MSFKLSAEFKALRSELAKIIHLTPAQLDAAKYMCTGLVPADRIASIHTGYDMLIALEELRLIDFESNSCNLIIELLESPAVGRKDLAKDISKRVEKNAREMAKKKRKSDKDTIKDGFSVDILEGLFKMDLKYDKWTHPDYERKEMLKGSTSVYKGLKRRPDSISPLHGGVSQSIFGILPAREVAIKMCAANGLVGAEKGYQRQVDALRALQQIHKGTVGIIGLMVALPNTTPPSLVMELAPLGDLLAYMKEKENKFELVKLVNFATQIAEAMAFVEENKYIHCNLRASNVLLFPDDNVKIGGFSSARRSDDAKACEIDDDAVLPIKWIAIEVALYRQFNAKSDVWSFGILLVEMLTRGDEPYPEMDNATVLAKLRTGFRHPAPSKCPRRLYDEVMTNCWKAKMADRPAFSQLKETLMSILESISSGSRKLVTTRVRSIFPMALEDPVAPPPPAQEHEVVMRRNPSRRTSRPPTAWELPRTSVELMEKIGSGEYGSVWKARYNQTELVAVKTLRPNKLEPEKFLDEARTLKALRHPHIVRLFGVCLQDGAASVDDDNEDRIDASSIYIVTELLELGDLRRYLQRDGGSTVTLKRLIEYAIQIADAMSYVETMKYVHRDIAARNVLVADGGSTVKLADFGLSRCIVHSDYYTLATDLPLPIRWMAPEATRLKKFSIKSDVWSFGILVIEMLSYGETPYPEMNAIDVLLNVERGHRHPKPGGCPDDLYELTITCWRTVPINRPSFDVLRTKLTEILDAQSKSVPVYDAMSRMSLIAGDVAADYIRVS